MGKFDIYKLVYTEEGRPMMKGVYHEGGFRVACDAIIMLAQKFDYPSEYEGKSVLKDGSFVPEGKYPKWAENCNPLKGHYGDNYKPIEVDVVKFDEWLKTIREEYKAENGKGKRWGDKWVVKIGPCLLKAENLQKFFDARKEIGGGSVMVSDYRRPIYSANGESFVMLMPITVYGEDYNKEALESVYEYKVLELA